MKHTNIPSPKPFFSSFYRSNDLVFDAEDRILVVYRDSLVARSLDIEERMGLESELVSFVSVISRYLLIPFTPEQHSPSAVIAATLAYPLFLSFLLTSAAANLGRSMFGVVLETLERVCLLVLMILASPAWVYSWLKRCSVRRKAPTSTTFRPEHHRARPAQDESSWERASDFVSELYPAFDILGLRPDASHSEIRGAYRRLMKIHHPDRFMKASPAEQERARRRTVEIRSAYEEALTHHPYIH